MKTIMVLAFGFTMGVMYMNGTLGEFGDITTNLVNSVAQQVVDATEPTTLEKIENKVVDITNQ
jgi:hypothetical protein